MVLQNQTCIDTMTVAQAKQYIEEKQFEAGTMLPKIEAAIFYSRKETNW
jgi:carbamate kinase